MPAEAWRLTVGAVACLLAIAVIVYAWWASRRPTPYGKPSHTTDAMWWLMQQLLAEAPGSQCGGTYANKPGYHNQRNALPGSDYSVCDRPPDDGGPGDVCAALDWTFPDAQRGDYTTISRYTRRLIDSGKDPDDPRCNGWRECYGNADTDTYVEGYDFRYSCAVSSDPSHLWHIHLSESRSEASSYNNKKALLSVIRGETVQQWYASQQPPTPVGGVMLLNDPRDPKRTDLFYVGADDEVWHSWWTTGGMNAMWDGDGRHESLGGRIQPGTLSAVWTPDGNALYITGLGTPDPDDPDMPPGCGPYYGFVLQRTGARSGWGSLDHVYGAYG
jgi:hypothetical protein